MPGFECCPACSGFVVDLAVECVHCGAPPPRRRHLARLLVTRLIGVASAVTLMACYGMTAEYDCHSTNSCPCYADSDCQEQYYCDEAYATCEWGGSCYDEIQCTTGFDCDPVRNTCIPVPPGAGCTSHYDCAIPEERCDFPTGACVPTMACSFDGATCGEASRCDPNLGICVPCDGDACGSCTGEITCAATPPACPTGTRPGIELGCYTAACIPELVCLAAECLPLGEAACLASASCDPTYAGINCTDPEGDPCTETTSNCTCESFEFDTCVPAPPT